MGAKEHILKAATDLFCRKGYHLTTIRDIAESASVNSAMVSYYFRSKENLYLHILEALPADFKYNQHAVNEVKDIHQRIRIFVDQTRQLYKANPEATYLAMIEHLQASTNRTACWVKTMEQKHYTCFCSMVLTQQAVRLVEACKCSIIAR